MGNLIIGLGATGLFLTGCGVAANAIGDLLFKRKVSRMVDSYTEILEPTMELCQMMIEQVKSDMTEE